MWCEIDKSKLPIVKVNFTDKTQIEEEFNYLLDEWQQFYSDKIPFYFVFDTRNVSSLNIKYAYKMSNFIKQLKKKEHQYLKGTIIIVKNQYVRFLLNIVFSITRPVADVYLFSKHSDLMITEDIYNIKTENNFRQVIMDYKDSFTCIKSRCTSVETASTLSTLSTPSTPSTEFITTPPSPPPQSQHILQ